MRRSTDRCLIMSDMTGVGLGIYVVAAIPIGVPALFLVGEGDKILDAETGEEQVLSSRI